MSATSSASLSAASAVTTPGLGSTPGKDPKKKVDPSVVSKTFLACGLCSDLYVDPKLLPCFHSFCKRCLSSYIPDHSLSLACPSCRQHSILPVAGVPALRDNHFLVQLLQQMERLGQKRINNCHEDTALYNPVAKTEDDGNQEVVNSSPTNDACDDEEHRNEQTTSLQDRSVFDSTADDLSIEIDNSSEVFDEQLIKSDEMISSAELCLNFPSITTRCLQHESSNLNHFCVDCDTAICNECLQVEHRKHSVQRLEEFSTAERSSLEKLLNNVRESTKSIDTSLRNIAKTKLKLERQRFEAEECVEKTFATIREALDKKKESLIADIETGSSGKSKKLDDQKLEVTRLKRTIETCCSFIESCLDEKVNQVSMILARKELSEKLEQFCRSQVQLLPEENPFISFNQGKLSVLTNIIEESLKQSKNPTPVQGTPPMAIKTSKTKTNQEIRRSGKTERPQKSRRPPTGKTTKTNLKAGDSADSEASSESSGSASISIGPQDFGSIVHNSAVPHETTASGEYLRRCFINIPALITVTSKNAKGTNVTRGGAKLTAKIYILEVGYKSKSESNKSDVEVSNNILIPDNITEDVTVDQSFQIDDVVVEPLKDQRVSFHQNSLTESSISGEGTTQYRKEDIVTISKADEIKARSVYKRTLIVPEVHDVGDGTYEITYTMIENALKRYPPANHSTLDVSKSSIAESGRLTPQSPSCTPTHRDLHSSLDKLQQKRRPKSAPEESDLLETIQLEIKLYGQQIKGSPFSLKVRKEAPKFPKDQKIPSSSSYLNSRHTADWNSRRHSGSGAVKRALLNSKPPCSGGNRKPSSASASQNDGPCQRIGVKGHNKGEFMNLQGIAVYEDKIYVADSNGQCVQVFSLDGKCILKFGAKGRSPGQLQRPTGVTCTPDGQHILVSDYENKWVGVYTNEGKYVNRLGQGKLAGPKGVSIDKQGRVVIVDNRSSTVWLYSLNGKILGKFGARGICASSGSSSPSASSPSGFISTTEAHARLAGPHFCSIDPEDGDVVVTDFHNHKVKVFSSDGQYKFSFGSAGDGNGQFNAPTGICVDKQGNILVADWGNSRIQIFDKNGSFLSHIDTSSDPLYGPQGLAISPDNSVVVADSGNHCLKVYKHLFA